MSKFDKEKYEKAKNEAYKFFEDNKKIKSACLGYVTLNSDGFMHLIRKNDKHKRDWKNQLKRFELLKYVKPVLEEMKFYQEYQKIKQPVKVKRNKTTLLEFKEVEYWSFIAVINDKIRIKIILKKVGNGNLIFWSIVPGWKLQGYKELKKVNLSKGDLEND